MGGAITGNGERAEEENEGDPPHLRPLPSNFSALVAPMSVSRCLRREALFVVCHVGTCLVGRYKAPLLAAGEMCSGLVSPRMVYWSLYDASLLGLPDLPYFTADPVFQPRSPASRKEAVRETESPVFDYRLIQIGRIYKL